jgi:hypothetical protein
MDWLRNTGMGPQTMTAAAPGVQGGATMAGPPGYMRYNPGQLPPGWGNRMAQAAPAAAPAAMAGPPGYMRNNPGQLPPGWANRMAAAAPAAAPAAAAVPAAAVPAAVPAGPDLGAALAARLPPGLAERFGPAPVVAEGAMSPMAAAIAGLRARGLGNDPRGALSDIGAQLFPGQGGPVAGVGPVQRPGGWALPPGLAALPPGWGSRLGVGP